MQNSKSDIDLVITVSRRLETLLEKDFGAEGRGLGTKLKSVEDQLDAQAVRSGRYVVAMRNKMAHEDGFSLPDRPRFLQEAAALEKAITGALSKTARSKTARIATTARFPRGVVISVAGLLGMYMVIMEIGRYSTAHPEVEVNENLLLAAYASGLAAIVPPFLWLRQANKRRGRRFRPLYVLGILSLPSLPFIYIPIELGRYALLRIRQAVFG
jgi:hypothetical protein